MPCLEYELGLVGSFDHMYQVNTATGQATQIGLTDFTDGLGAGEGIFKRIYALAATNEEPELTPVSITSVETNAAGEVVDT